MIILFIIFYFFFVIFSEQFNDFNCLDSSVNNNLNSYSSDNNGNVEINF